MDRELEIRVETLGLILRCLIAEKMLRIVGYISCEFSTKYRVSIVPLTQEYDNIAKNLSADQLNVNT